MLIFCLRTGRFSLQSCLKIAFAINLFFLACPSVFAQRTEVCIEKDWKFIRGDYPEAYRVAYDDSSWEVVEVPHDWAIYGPFDGRHDLQHVAITQNLETEASLQTGRTGGLPYVGVGWYRTRFDVAAFDKDAKQVVLLFDGAMSEARVYMNGREVCFWPYGYNAFHCDVTDALTPDGKNNTLAVRLENRPESSRWYPGAGLYRNVHLIVTDRIHVPVWGTYVTTPYVSEEYASVRLLTEIEHAGDRLLEITTRIYSPRGQIVAERENRVRPLSTGNRVEQNFLVGTPELWSPETPALYRAVTTISENGRKLDEYTTRFGIREIAFIADKGFFLNGRHRKFQGVCNHHDLGPLGAAVNRAALRRQLTLLKDMGCDAIRTAHNMPAPELVELCDEMGFMVVVEAFDEWNVAKCRNGYHRFFDEWAERDMVNMIRHFRNHPSVVMWSIGNEVSAQCDGNGREVALFLQGICHREDPMRPVTCGMDQVQTVIENGFAATLDIPGFNYRVHLYEEAYGKLPQNLVLGSETASTLSSRGVYKFPLKPTADARYEDHQCCSYDLGRCSWSNLPDDDFVMADDYDWTLGQFVWTGFDYLGEPTPYGSEGWPNHSSMFGIFDLASLPKDRYYLYRSQWNHRSNTLHILPHWTWPGREGEITPIFVYTNYPEAELFVNGKSYGRRSKSKQSPQHRYRLMWSDVVYEPGEIRVLAYNEKGAVVDETSVRTAGKPYRIELEADRLDLQANGKDLAYITVRLVDKQGNLCPTDGRFVRFAVEGAGKYRAAANGDPTCLDLFHLPHMHLFNGQLTAIVQTGTDEGTLRFKADAAGVKGAEIELQVMK